ncbi:MAG: TerY-C metal binding domain-containing protein [Faecousia sp.]
MEAVILLQRCNQTGRIFGNRVEKRGDDWYKTWAFPISEQQAKKERYDQDTIYGLLYTAEEYPGCPYCGTKSSVICSCGKLSCWHGETEMPCNWCNTYMRGIGAGGPARFVSGEDL